MTDDKPRHHYYIIRDIIGFGAYFNGFANRLQAPSQIDRSFDLEARLARSARSLNRALSELECAMAGASDGLVPRQQESATTRLRTMLLDRLKRWGWSDILAPGADQEIEDRLSRWREVPALSAARPTITQNEFREFDGQLTALGDWLLHAEAPILPDDSTTFDPEFVEFLFDHPAIFMQELRARATARDQQAEYESRALDLGGLHRCLLAVESINEFLGQCGLNTGSGCDGRSYFDKVIEYAPGRSDLEKYLHSKRGEDLTAATVDNIVRELAVKRCLGFPEVKGLPLVDVVAALNAAEPPPARPPMVEAEDLTETQADILQAAIELGATDLKSARPLAEIARHAGVGSQYSRNVRAAKKALTDRGFLKARSKTGQWITAEGKAALLK